jgi:hypothetical protein
LPSHRESSSELPRSQSDLRPPKTQTEAYLAIGGTRRANILEKVAQFCAKLAVHG